MTYMNDYKLNTSMYQASIHQPYTPIFNNCTCKTAVNWSVGANTGCFFNPLQPKWDTFTPSQTPVLPPVNTVKSVTETPEVTPTEQTEQVPPVEQPDNEGQPPEQQEQESSGGSKVWTYIGIGVAVLAVIIMCL